MAEKKCPNCSYTTDDESISVCPECEAELEYDSVLNSEDETKSDEAKDVCEETSEEDFDADYNNPNDENNQPEADDETENKKSGKGFTVAITALIILIFFGIVYIGATIWANDNGVVKTSGFSQDDVAGVYVSDTAPYKYYFSFEEIEIKVEEPSEDADAPSDSEATSDAQATSDAEASSDSEAVTKEPVFTVQTYHGQYSLKYTDEAIRENLLIEFIQSNQEILDSYYEYAEEKGLGNNDLDLEGFIAANKLGKDVMDYDSQSGLTESMKAQTVESGLWRYKDNKIELADSNGNVMEYFDINSKGFINSSSYYKGSVKPGASYPASYSLYIEDANVTQEFTLYGDGNMIISIAQDGAEKTTPALAGTYEIDGDKLTLTHSQGKNVYTILDDGFAMILKKE